MKQKVVAVLWPDENNFERFRDICSVDELHNSLAQYQAVANVKLRQLEQQGIDVERMPFNTEELLIYANERRRPVDGQLRAEYAADLLFARERGN